MAKTSSKDFAKALTQAYALDPEGTLDTIMQHIDNGWISWVMSPKRGGLPGPLKLEVEKRLAAKYHSDGKGLAGFGPFNGCLISRPKALNDRDSRSEPKLLLVYQHEWTKQLRQPLETFYIRPRTYGSIKYVSATAKLNKYKGIHPSKGIYTLTIDEFAQRAKFELLRWEKPYKEGVRQTPERLVKQFFLNNCRSPKLKDILTSLEDDLLI